MFNDAVDELGLLELPLLDSLYTWSNKRATPTLARLDRAFVNNDHSLAFPSTHLTSLVRQTSDHKPLLVSMSTNIPKSQVFRFENAWLKNAQFLPEVLPAWHGNGSSSDAAGCLAGKLKSVREAAKHWARRNRGATHLDRQLQIHYSTV